jgi:hypothetical protein
MRGNHGAPAAGAQLSARSCTASSSKPLPLGVPSNVAGNSKDKAIRREREMAILRQRVEFDWRI